MSDKLLYENQWVQVRERDGWYTYTRGKQSDGKAIMCLVYDFSNEDEPKLLARYEHNPVHLDGTRSDKDSKYEMTSITGSYEPDMTLEEVVIMELKEEAGLEASEDELESLGMIYISKSSDVACHLYAIDGSQKELGEPSGDGSKGEEGAYVEWVPATELLLKSNCPMVSCAFNRLVFKE